MIPCEERQSILLVLRRRLIILLLLLLRLLLYFVIISYITIIIFFLFFHFFFIYYYHISLFFYLEHLHHLHPLLCIPLSYPKPCLLYVLFSASYFPPHLESFLPAHLLFALFRLGFIRLCLPDFPLRPNFVKFVKVNRVASGTLGGGGIRLWCVYMEKNKGEIV